MPRTAQSALICVLAVSFAAISSAQDQIPQVKLRGSVKTLLGVPVQGARVSNHWSVSSGKATSLGQITTTIDGKFEGAFEIYSFPTALTVIDYEKNFGGSVVVTEAGSRHDIEIEVGPLSTVAFELAFDGERPEWMGMYAWSSAERLQVVFSEDTFSGEIKLPTGSYQLYIYSEITEPYKADITLKAGQRLDLGSIDVKLTGLGKSFGKKALPLTFAEARGVKPDFTLDDLKGKWVLLEFWGFW